jgi:hypothetical protein
MTIALTQALFPASGLINLQPGKYFFCSALPVGGYAIQIWGKSGSEQFGNASNLIAPLGLKLGRVKGWSQCQLWGTPASTITYFYGDEVVAPQDITDILSQIATISGNVVVQQAPSATIAALAPLNTALIVNGSLFAQTPGRRRITIFSDPANAGVVYLVDPTGADKVGFIQPGTFIEFDTTSALNYTDPVGGNLIYFLQES